MADGIEEVTDKGSEKIIGIKEIKKKYFESWYLPDDKSGTNYEEKIKLFLSTVLLEEMEEHSNFHPVATEQSFDFVYDNRVIIQGFIDRIDANEDGIRVVDYKTSKKIYDASKIATPLQMIVYALACLHLYGVLPIEYLYRFIFINESQLACSKGYITRGLKKLDKLLDQMDTLKQSGEFSPSPTPLCYWCEFAGHTPNADPKMKNLCPYYSLWTPSNKTFAVNQPYNATDKDKNNIADKSQARKLVF